MTRSHPLTIAALAVALTAGLAAFAGQAAAKPAPAPAPSPAAPAIVSARFPSLDPEANAAYALLEGLKTKYVLLDGVTIELGPTPRNEQAVAYYTQSRIVVDPNHRAGLRQIILHEIWHMIDYRDNGVIDWGEAVPPLSASDYLK